MRMFKVERGLSRNFCPSNGESVGDAGESIIDAGESIVSAGKSIVSAGKSIADDGESTIDAGGRCEEVAWHAGCVTVSHTARVKGGP